MKNKTYYLITGIYIILIIGIYYSSLQWLIFHDWTREDYSYGVLIPFFILYLIWEKRQALSGQLSVPSMTGLFLLIISILLFWIGELGGEFFTVYFSLWAVVFSLSLLHMGWKKLKTIIFPLILSLGMFPLPEFIHGRLTLNLKLLSSQFGVFLMQLMGMTAYRSGNIIDLDFTKLQVVDACSGLRFFIPLVIMGILIAYFFHKIWWKRIVLVLSTIPIAVLINGLRIFSVGFLYQFWGKAAAEGFFHDFSGWVILTVSLAFLYLESFILKRLCGKETERQSSADDNKTVQGAGFNIQGEKAGSRLFSVNFILSVLLLGVTLAASQGIEFREKTPSIKNLSDFPVTIDEWEGTARPLDQKYINTLDFTDYVMMNYLNQKKQLVNFYVAYYESQQKGEAIHSPDTCLPSEGFIFKESGLIELPASMKNGSPVKVKRALMQKGNIKRLAYYWFPMRGRILTNAYQIKFYTFWDAVTRQRTDGALVRLITPIYKNENTNDADTRLKKIAEKIIPALNQFLPE